MSNDAPRSVPTDINKVLTQRDFDKVLCRDCGRKPEEHTVVLRNCCHDTSAVEVKYSAGRLYIDCYACGRGIAIVQVAP